MAVKEKILTESEVISMLSDIYQDHIFEELKQLYLTKSFPEILAVDRREMSHSAFLAWLFNMNENHGLGDYPFKQFLKILVMRDLKQGISRHDNNYKNKTSTQNIAAAAVNDDIVISDMSISLEKPVNVKNKRGRLDIMINSNVIISGKRKEIHIIIENKVYSNEYKQQTANYFNAKVNNILNNRHSYYLFVYLTPLQKRELDNLNAPQCSNKEYIQINYQDILDKILEPVLSKNISARTRFIIEEYIHSLSLSALNLHSKEPIFNFNTIMAISKRTTELLNGFWKKNEPLLMAVLGCLVENTDDEDVQEKLKPAIEALAINKRREKDKTHYKFNRTECNGKFSLLSAVISQIINNGISPEDCSKDCVNALNGLKNKSKDEVYKTIKNCLNSNNVKMTCPSAVELYDPNKVLINKKLVYNETDYQNWWKSQGKKKEIYNQVGNLRILNQWGYDTIDYFIYAFYFNRAKWNLASMNIEVIKQN